MRSWEGWSSCGGAIFGHLSTTFGAAAQHGGSSDSLNTLWEASTFECRPSDIKTTRLPQRKLMCSYWCTHIVQTPMLKLAQFQYMALNVCVCYSMYTFLTAWCWKLFHRQPNLNCSEQKRKIYSADIQKHTDVQGPENRTQNEDM